MWTSHVPGVNDPRVTGKSRTLSETPLEVEEMVTGLNWLLACATALLEGAGAAKLSTASKPPVEQKRKAKKTRGLKKADCDWEFFFIGILF
jgi:hypothetical protein